MVGTISGRPQVPYLRFELAGGDTVVSVRVKKLKFAKLRDLPAFTVGTGVVKLTLEVKRSGRRVVTKTRRVAIKTVHCNSANQQCWPRDGLTDAALTKDGKVLALVYDRVPVLTRLSR